MKFSREIYQLDNIVRAWQWVKSNPDSRYKSYFRELYAAFSIAENNNLKFLADKLRQRIYQPSSACKLFLPKPSGLALPQQRGHFNRT